MERYMIIPVIMLFCIMSSCKLNDNHQAEVKVMSFNIRFPAEEGRPHDWSKRKENLLQLILDHPSDFIGLQEAVPIQVEYLAENLPEYGYTSRSREASPDEGEAVPIFYNREKWNMVEDGHFWLSDTPEVPGSVTWGNAWIRMVTWGIFVHRENADTILVINTHFDNVSQPSREKSTELTLERIEKKANGHPVLLIGDLNVREDNIVIEKIEQEGFSDTYREVHPEPQQTDFTFHGWTDPVGHSRIDYIFARGHGETIDSYVIREHEGEIYPSDHFAVFSHIKIE